MRSIGEDSHVAQLIAFACCNLAQGSADQLSRSRLPIKGKNQLYRWCGHEALQAMYLGQVWHDENFLWRSEGTGEFTFRL